MEGLKKKSRVRIAAITIAAAVIATALILYFVQKEKPPIQIGAIISLSGPSGHLVDVKNGMLMAVDEANSFGGINGRKIKLILRDSKTNPEEGKKAFNIIESAHHPVLYVSTTSLVSIALAPLAEKNKVPLIGLVVATPEFTKKNQWAFKFYTSAENEIKPIIHILKKLKLKKLGVLYQNDEYGNSVLEQLKKGFEKIDGTVIAEPFKAKNPDFKDKIISLKDAEGVYVVGFVKAMGQAVKKLREENYKGAILGTSGYTTPELISTTPEVNGVYTAAPAIYKPNYLFARQAKEKYEAIYHKTFTHHAANGYDFIKLLVGLLEDKNISRQGIKNVLEGSFMYQGVFGTISVETGKHDILIPLLPARIVNGRVHYLE